jgi:ABC-2 type transport system permease protein
MIDGFRYGFFGRQRRLAWLSLGVSASAMGVVGAIAVHLLRIGYKIRS